MRFITLFVAGLLASFAINAATIEATVAPTTIDANGVALPASGAGSLTSHRFELGTCSGSAFGTALQTKVVAMPAIKATFTAAPSGVLCIRAFALNSFGEGLSYPVSVVGPVPGNSGSIILIKVGP